MRLLDLPGKAEISRKWPHRFQRRIDYHSQPNTGPFQLLIYYGSRDDWPMV
jgi:hypothetical protein